MSSDNNAIISDDKTFIINMAINRFNTQYNKDLTRDDMDVISIEGNSFSEYAYEVYTLDTEDSVRLRLYLNLDSTKNSLADYKLREAEPNPLTGPESYAYISTGFINEAYVWSEIIELDTLLADITADTLNLENDEPFLLESGEPILLEVA